MSIPNIISLTINAVVTVVLLALALLIRVGKGDKLIAGYNTASERERAKYDAIRLRKVVAGCLLIIAVLMWIPMIVEALTGKAKSVVYLIWSLLILVVIIGTLILANTWAKKKK
jgi:hypothetical protein